MAEGRDLEVHAEEPPGFWSLIWLLFMQPVTLHRRLKACGIEYPNAPGMRLWRTAGDQRHAARRYVVSMFAVLFFATPMLAAFAAIICALFGLPVSPLGVTRGVAVGVAFVFSFSPVHAACPLGGRVASRHRGSSPRSARLPRCLLPYHRLKHLERAEQTLNVLENRLLAAHSFESRTFGGTLKTWQAVTAELKREAEAEAVHQLPNPFRIADPLTPEQGREVFRGRERIIETIESLLADPAQGRSIALIGPRRCGKTSLLRMLPVMLPDTPCVFFDLQDNPVDSPAGFFRALARRAAEQARRDRRLELPTLPDGSPFEAASLWLEQLEQSAGEHRILICIDEFEHLETLFPGDARALMQLMGLFRATIARRLRCRPRCTHWPMAGCSIPSRPPGAGSSVAN
jgi:hypothetical protein